MPQRHLEPVDEWIEQPDDGHVGRDHNQQPVAAVSHADHGVSPFPPRQPRLGERQVEHLTQPLPQVLLRVAVAGTPAFDVSHHDAARYRCVRHVGRPSFRAVSVDTALINGGFSM